MFDTNKNILILLAWNNVICATLFKCFLIKQSVRLHPVIGIYCACARTHRGQRRRFKDVARGCVSVWMHTWVYMLYCIHLWVPIKTLTHLHSITVPTSDPQAFDNTTYQVENKKSLIPDLQTSPQHYSHTQSHIRKERKKTKTHLYRVSSEKSHHHKNKSQSRGNPTTFKQINMCLCTHKHPQKCSCTRTRTHTDTHVHHSLPELRNTVDTVIHTPSELNQRFHLEGKHQAPLLPPITGAWKRSQQPQFYTITSSGRKSAPFRFCFEHVRCRPGLRQKPLKLSYSEREPKWLELLVEKDSIQFRTETWSTLFFFM